MGWRWKCKYRTLPQAELEYLAMTSQESYTQMEEVQKRLVELLSYQRNRLASRKRTEMVVEMVRLIESEGQFPKADYALDNGVLTLDLTQLIESKDNHWVSEIECSRNINWEGHWRRVDEVDDQLRTQHPECPFADTVGEPQPGVGASW